MDRINKAVAFASQAHIGQKRKYTGEPYVTHVIRVAELLQSSKRFFNETNVIIALLHDTVEDTSVTYEELKKEFGEEVMIGVWWLTDPDHKAGNRATRKALTKARLAAAPPDIQTIKYCDLIDNTGSIMKHDPGFGRVYLAEKQDLLTDMNRGDNTLWCRAYDMSTQYRT